MGYRSDVGLVLRYNVVEDFYNLEKQVSNKQLFKQLLERATDVSVAPNGDSLFVWHSIKWYENDKEWYPDIYAVMNFLDTLNLEDYFYCCIGESLEDNEERGFYYDNPFGLCINRHLDYCCRD